MLQKISYLSLFPEVIEQGLSHSLIGKARASGKIVLSFFQLRNFTNDKHRSVDDTVYGGGAGMLLKADILWKAWSEIKTTGVRPYTILLSPQGKLLTQERAKQLSREHSHLLFICGHYEGVDERFIEACVDEELSIGDYVLTGGEIAAVVASEVIIRTLPDVLGNVKSLSSDSLENGLLKAPQYTRPREFLGKPVPDVLLSGDHAAIDEWRAHESKKRTLSKRPELFKNHQGESSSSKKNIHQIALVLLHYPVTNRAGEPVTTAVTNLDIHDISRTCRTYEIDHFFLVNPIEEQAKLVEEILNYWRTDRAKTWHPDRFEALSRTEFVPNFSAVRQALAARYPGQELEVVMPDARPIPNQKNYEETKARWVSEPESTVKVIVLGTGGGVAPSFYPEVQTYLEPIYGPLGDQGTYNHLSVRAAAAIILDRLFGK